MYSSIININIGSSMLNLKGYIWYYIGCNWYIILIIKGYSYSIIIKYDFKVFFKIFFVLEIFF